MIYTVTLNPTIDRAMTVPRFAVGGTYKADECTCQAAGKGINVARVASTLEEPAIALGLVGRQDQPFFAEALAAIGVESRLVPVPGPTRISVTVLDPVAGTGTHLRELGAIPPAGSLEEVLATLDDLSAGDWVVLSGSLPPGLREDTYGVLIEHCRQRGAQTVLDTSGAALLAAVDAGPTLLKPNLFELWQIDCRQADVSAEHNPEEWAVDEICAAARRLLARGLQRVVVSLGARGVLGIEEGGAAWRAAVTLDQPVVDTVGCGDALAAGLVVSLARGESFVDALCLGVSCGAANALVRGAGRCERTDIERFFARAVVGRL